MGEICTIYFPSSRVLWTFFFYNSLFHCNGPLQVAIVAIVAGLVLSLRLSMTKPIVALNT